MSPPPDQIRTGSKFTKGEKCIYANAIVIFSLIILASIVYIIHLLIVNHSKDEVFLLFGPETKSISARRDVSDEDYQYVGMIYVNDSSRVMCNTLLLSEHWSLAPGQCTAMRTDPKLSNYLGYWKIMYKFGKDYIRTDIKASLTHTHFNRADYDNNIGLFAHQDPIPGKYYVLPKAIVLDDEVFQKYTGAMYILDWDMALLDHGTLPEAVVTQVTAMNYTTCSSYADAVVETLRKYEFCVTFVDHQEFPLAHGAMFVMDSKVIGFFSWGDIKGKGVPFVILNILNYKQWLQNIIL